MIERQDPSDVRIGTWNAEWICRTASQGKCLGPRLSEPTLDEICLTEGLQGILADPRNFTISDLHWAPAVRHELSKVLHWNARQWADVDRVGSTVMLGGRILRALPKPRLAGP